MRYLSAVPAYGRNYKTEEEVRAAWDKGADFRVMDLMAHGYVSKNDLPDNTTLNVRYDKQQEVCVITPGCSVGQKVEIKLSDAPWLTAEIVEVTPELVVTQRPSGQRYRINLYDGQSPRLRTIDN